LAREGQSGAVPVLRAVPRRSRLQGASGSRAFQDLYCGPGAAAAGKARAHAVHADLIGPSLARGHTIARSGDFLKMNAEAAKLPMTLTIVSSAALAIAGQASGCKRIAHA